MFCFRKVPACLCKISWSFLVISSSAFAIFGRHFFTGCETEHSNIKLTTIPVEPGFLWHFEVLKLKTCWLYHLLIFFYNCIFRKKGKKSRNLSHLENESTFWNLSNLGKWKHILKSFKFRKMKAHFEREPHFRIVLRNHMI